MPFEEDRLQILVIFAALFLLCLVAFDIAPRLRYRRLRERTAENARGLGAERSVAVLAGEPPLLSAERTAVRARPFEPPPDPPPPVPSSETRDTGVTVVSLETEGTLLMRQYPAWTLSRDRHLVMEEGEDGSLRHFLDGFPLDVGDELEVELINGAWLRGRYEWGGRPGEAPRLIAWVRHPRSHPTIESTGYALLLDALVQLRWVQPPAKGTVKRIQYARLP